MLGLTHPLHRRRVCLGIQKIKDKEEEEVRAHNIAAAGNGECELNLSTFSVFARAVCGVRDGGTLERPSVGDDGSEGRGIGTRGCHAHSLVRCALFPTLPAEDPAVSCGNICVFISGRHRV